MKAGYLCGCQPVLKLGIFFLMIVSVILVQIKRLDSGSSTLAVMGRA